MTAQLVLFDGLAERERILRVMSENNNVYLEAVRAFARDIARRKGDVSIDDVREELERRNFPLPSDFGKTDRLLGAIFTKKEFSPIRQIPTSRAEVAKRVGRARSFITVYSLKGVA